MDRILAGLDFVRCYIDDILVFSTTVEEHQVHLQAVLQRVRTHGLRLHPRKCKFFQEQVEYLGHVIYPGGIQSDREAIDFIAEGGSGVALGRGAGESFPRAQGSVDVGPYSAEAS
ncbi:unnamed protein product [Calypogeia fissa]